MLPGMGRGMSPRRMKAMMKRAGIDVEEIEGVEEVTIKTSSKEYVIKDAYVTLMKMHGQNTFQIVGEPKIIEKEGVSEKESIPDEDVKLVMEQTNVSEEEARAALEECGGNPAEAIIKLMSNE